MATILTVHGTGATGLETGEQWWQKGSEFEGRMRRLVEPEEGDEGELNFQPVIWDGANSETSRRAAGTQLCGKMNELEARGEPYSIIGHSHGGSVISAALINHAGKRCTLDHLKNWITVGTPFIQSRKERFLFLRLGMIGKAAYVALMFLGLVIASLSITGAMFRIFKDTPSLVNVLIAVAIIVVISLILLIPFMIFYLINRMLERNKTFRYRTDAIQYLNKKFTARYTSFWHRNDEALQGLASLKSIKIDIFDKDFAARGITLLSVFLLPVMFLVLILTPSLMRSYHSGTKSYVYSKPAKNPVVPAAPKKVKPKSFDGENVSDNLAYLVASVVKIANKAKVCSTVFGVGFCNGWVVRVVQGVLVTALFLMILALAATYLVSLIANAISSLIARILNPVAMSQIKATAFGSDAQADAAVDVRSWPMWMERGQPSLPDELANEIQAHADKAAALAIPKFRNAARLFASAGDDANSAGTGSKNASSSDMLSEYLTWDELIHTSYFTNQRFCKLVAYALTQNGGLRATAAFKADPDYALVAKWHEGIVGTGVGAAGSVAA